MNQGRAFRFLPLLALLGLCLPGGTVSAQKESPVKKDSPRVTVVLPLGAAPGKTTRLTIRGLKLENATALKFTNPRVTAKILSKGKVGVPNKVPPARAGDSQVVAEVTLPPDVPAGPLPFVVVTPGGESVSHPLLVETALPVIEEKEPNNGFRTAQKIQVPQAVDGVIQHPQDVDVFRLEGKTGQKLTCEVLAARYGSSLDSILTLYDARGQHLATNDDFGESRDSRLDVTLPADGAYYLAVIDAFDLGGPTHVYRLVVQLKK